MGLRAELDRLTLPIQKLIARDLAPDPATLGYPLFSARIKDRRQRWQVGKQPNPYQAVASKIDGAAYMQSLGHPVPEVYGVYPSLDALPRFEDLPPSFVLKPVGGWYDIGLHLVQDGLDWPSMRHLTREDVIRQARSRTGPARAKLEGSWIAEELLLSDDGSGKRASDCKFFCFGPKVVLISLGRRDSQDEWRNRYWYRDADWRPIPFRVRWDRLSSRVACPRPDWLDDMLRIVTDVGRRLNIFLRIDMYPTERGPVFGEFTAYPHMGTGFTPRCDAWLGSHWTTPDGGIDLSGTE